MVAAESTQGLRRNKASGRRRALPPHQRIVVSHFRPHLNRDAAYRILKAKGLNRLPLDEKARKPHGSLKDYEVGFIHVDVKHLPKLQDRERVSRKPICTSPSIGPLVTCT